MTRFTAKAENDVQEAFDWYHERNPDKALEFLERVDEALFRISDNPLRYPALIGDARRILLEQFPYSLWYRSAAETTVFAVLHGKRNPALARRRASEPNP